MGSSGFFGEPGTYGERDNKILFRHGVRTIDAATEVFELLTLELHIADLRDQFEKGNITFKELDDVREVAKKLMNERIRKMEKAMENK